MIDNYYTFDNIISIEEQNILLDYVKKDDIDWNDIKNITGDYGGKEKTHKFPAKVHPSIDCKNDLVNKIINSIELNVSEKLDLEFIKNYRWKINWTKPMLTPYNPIDLIHCDTVEEHIVIVYYINDASGNTNIYDDPKGNNGHSFKINYKGDVDFDSFKLIESVSPKMGRCFVFNGKLNHYGDYPTNGDRYIINFNFVAKKRYFSKNSKIY